MGLTLSLVRTFILCICLSVCHSLADLPSNSEPKLSESEIKNTQTTNSLVPKKSPEELKKIGIKSRIAIQLILDRYLLAIEQKESMQGPYNPELAEMLYGLGNTLQLNNQPNKALAIYKKALYIKRINNGLHDLSQEAILRGIIKNQTSQGKITEATASYGQLLQVYLKTYGENNPELIPLMKEISQWHVNTYLQTGGRNDGYHLEISFQLYSDAIRLSKEGQEKENIKTLSLMNDLATTCYYLSAHQQLYPDFGNFGASMPFGYRPMTPANSVQGRGAYFKHGKLIQEEIIQTLQENTNFTTIEKALGQTSLGDWYLLFGKYQLALNAHREAYNIMAENKPGLEALDKIYSKPVMLPKRTNFFDLQEPNKSKKITKLNNNSSQSLTVNYVNLVIDVTATGKATNFNIQKIYPEEMHKYGEQAIETVRSRKFRPRIKDGVPELTTGFPIRVILPNE
jgi:tetratricopeptide (TPR) repeat protein